MSYSEAEARIRRLLSRIADTERRMDSVQDKILRTRQDLAGFYQIGAGGCITTISGKIIGGDAAAAALAGSTIQVLGSSTSSNYGTYSATAGTYSIDLQLDPSDTSLDLIVTGPSPRFTTGSPVTRSVTHCTTNSLANIQATPATGYHYMTGANACQWPIKNTISYSEAAVFGSGTLTWSAGVWTKNCSTVTTLATGSCPSVAGVPVHISFTDSGTEFFQTLRSGVFPFCPMAGTCGTFANGTMGNGITGITRTYTCPDAVTLFSVAIVANASSASEFWSPGTGSLSITYYET